MPVGEHDTRMVFLPRNPEEQKEYEETIKKWEAEGFDMLPGSRAVAVFQLMKMREPAQQDPGMGAIGTIGINEDKVIHRTKDGVRIDAHRNPIPDDTGGVH